jgi:nucleosome assembly protein 1-like 1
VFEKDRAILQSLIDIRYELHAEGHGFDLYFDFEDNSYFKNSVLKKSFHQLKPNMIEKCEGTEIEWNEGADVTIKKVKKKSKKKGAKATTKTVKQDSFFNFFRTLSSEDKGENDDDDEKNDDDDMDIGEKMDEDFELGQKIKEEIIPLALEFYMDVIEQDEMGDDDDDEGDDDDDDDDQPKQKKKAKGGAGKAGDKEECKQQ